MDLMSMNRCLTLWRLDVEGHLIQQGEENMHLAIVLIQSVVGNQEHYPYPAR